MNGDERTPAGGPFDRFPRRLHWSGVGLAAMLAGCQPGSSTSSIDLQKALDAARVDVQRSERRNLELEDRIQAQERRIQNLTGFAPGTAAGLFVADRIELARLTGGADFDGEPGDDGVMVYLRPLDADGHVVKAPGEITVKLVDNNGPGEPRLLGRYVIDDPAELRKAWHSKFMTDHYTVRCPWNPSPEGKPTGPEVEIKVTFLDWRTGQAMTAHKVATVSLPGGRSGG